MTELLHLWQVDFEFVIVSIFGLPVFFVSKLLAAITQPIFWLALWWLLALLLVSRKPSSSARMLWVGLVVLGLLGFRVVPDALLRPLENRYPVPSAQSIERYAGVIVLGGALEHPASYLTHQQVPLGESAERMTVPLGLMRQYPTFELVFSGGEGRLLTTGITESALAKAFYQEQGVDMRRVVLEDGSRNTRENARQVAQLLGQRCSQEPWLLVTSAWHMPRAAREFEAVGCRITPYPADFRTGASTPWTEYAMAESLMRWQVALHEWLGLLIYGLTR